ncbi:uncharacterized protein LOC62_03G005194 [Vanrija pseudolonga]|uniref:Helicase ATP-binding domain-containing protein n=1 Tax=Vanrija pseudolonga TaxID=143232 RepID=A0AAF1BHY3_9TREE|nr:hypothetical protein LOC62_03G005194 [Vanrija pseudolonga]
MPPPSFREVTARAWDVYDLVCFLGIDELQTDEVRTGAPLIDRGKAHQKKSDGSYLYPNDHAIRSACQFPFFLDRTPRLHQLWAVATYFALAFSGDSRFNKVAHYLIADATGLGKTTMMAMIVAYHVWLKHRLREDPTFVAPVMAPEKVYLMKGKWKETVSQSAPVRFHPGDGVKKIEPVLIVTTTSVLPQIQDELCELLDGDHFIVAGLEKAHKSHELRHRKQFWNLLGKERVPVVITTWIALRDEFKEVFDSGDFKSDFKNISLFSSSSRKVIRWGMAFYDEVQTVRNPEAEVSIATASLSQVARMTFGTTATPFFNDPLDLLNILRALGTSDSDLRPPRSIPLPTSSSVRESTLGSLMKTYNVRAAYWPIIIQCRILENRRNQLQHTIKELRKNMRDGEDTIPLGSNWEFIALPVNDKSKQVIEDWAQWEKDVAELVMEPIAQLGQPFMLRRVLDTKDEDDNCLGCDV